MGKRGKRYFSPEVKLEVIRRYAAGETLKSLGEEYSIRPTLVHQWATLYRRYGAVSLRGPGRPTREAVARELLPAGAEESAGQSLTAAQRRIELLERKLAQQALEIDFFKHALRHFETVLPPADRPGATALIPSSGNKRNRKAD
jgi:transposase-like protein